MSTEGTATRDRPDGADPDRASAARTVNGGRAGRAARRGAGAGAPTIRQVAAAAGVSRATASRVINGGHLVSPTSREAVEKAIAELGFVPNAVARNLATRRTGSVALVVPEPNSRLLDDPFFGNVINGLSRSLEAADLQMILVVARPDGGHDRAVRYLTAGRVDGAVITSHHREDHVYGPLLDSGLPCVFVGRPLDVGDHHCVDMDNVGGARLATEHLVATGRRRIGTVAGPRDMSAGLDRLAGWTEALQAAGLPTDAVVHADFTAAGGAAATRRLLTAHPDLDAVFVASDLMAAGALGELRAAGRSVPGDVAVFGFDDLHLASTTEPPLSTVVHPVERMAERAGTMIVEMVADADVPPQRVEFEATLALRASA